MAAVDSFGPIASFMGVLMSLSITNVTSVIVVHRYRQRVDPGRVRV